MRLKSGDKVLSAYYLTLEESSVLLALGITPEQCLTIIAARCEITFYEPQGKWALWMEKCKMSEAFNQSTLWKPLTYKLQVELGMPEGPKLGAFTLEFDPPQIRTLSCERAILIDKLFSDEVSEQGELVRKENKRVMLIII